MSISATNLFNSTRLIKVVRHNDLNPFVLKKYGHFPRYLYNGLNMVFHDNPLTFWG